MRKFSIFHPLAFSFFSRELYQDIARNWKGVGILYLILLSVITSFSVTLQFHGSLKAVPVELTPVIDQLPDISIKKGEVSIDQEQPYFITDPSSQKNPVIIIDTTGKYTSLAGTNARILLTKTQLFFEDRVYDLSGLSEIEEFNVTRDGIAAVVRIFTNWFAWIAAPVILFFQTVVRIIQILVFALIGMLMARIIKVELRYSQLLRLSAAAITPVILTYAVCDLFEFKIPFFIRLVVNCAYLLYAVKVNAEQHNPPEAAV